jgi:hypothetical protein
LWFGVRGGKWDVEGHEVEMEVVDMVMVLRRAYCFEVVGWKGEDVSLARNSRVERSSRFQMTVMDDR